MEATTTGPNLTRSMLVPAALQAMDEAADELTPFDSIHNSAMEAQKLAYIDESDAVGSIPRTLVQPDASTGDADGFAILLNKLLLSDAARGRLPKVCREVGGPEGLKHNPAGAARKAPNLAPCVGFAHLPMKRPCDRSLHHR